MSRYTRIYGFTESKNPQLWNKIQSGNRVYYSAHVETFSKLHYIGDGTKVPTPKELVDLQNQYPGSDPVSNYAARESNIPLNENLAELPGGYYNYEAADYNTPERLIPRGIRTDGYIKLKCHYDPVAYRIKKFLESEEVYRSIEGGALYKLSLLSYGPPGEGKTSTIRQVIRDLIPKDSVIIFLHNIPSEEFLSKIKISLSERLKIFIFEELSSMVLSPMASTEDILDFMDGESSIDRSIVLATTNYPEKLPGNLMDRQGRFDAIYKFDHPKDEDLKLLLAHYLKRTPTVSELKALTGFSSAAIKECCLKSLILGETLEEAVLAIEKQRKLYKNEFVERGSMGLNVEEQAIRASITKKLKSLPEWIPGM